MGILQLKDYQQDALDSLALMLRTVADHGDPARAFHGITRNAYIEAPGLERTPYVCLRVPTGGGKTLLAAHAVAIAADTLLGSDAPLTLWLVPSQAIRDQTLRSLRNRRHPNRRALAARFGSNVRVMSVDEALRTSRADYDGGAVVIVATIQAFRVDETEGRKVYEPNGDLLDHFDGPPPASEDLERGSDGNPVPSLANVIRQRRPLVLVDEAHNARTGLSFETLARLAPGAIVEFTATPVRPERHSPGRGIYASNVLRDVSAAELKAADMIKLPIVLHGRADPREVLGDALAKLDRLSRLAAIEEEDGGRYVRPIMLVQAEAKSKDTSTLHAEVVRRLLIDDFELSHEQVAVATGDSRELDGIDLMARDCTIRVVVTQQALREGWDCPFAYVLCTLAEQRSSRAVEQLLGRILRLPGAARLSHPELNRAYAFSATTSFQETARTLQDGLVAHGFERAEAVRLVQVPQAQDTRSLPLILDEPLPAQLDVAALATALDELADSGITIDAARRTITIPRALSAEESGALLEKVPETAAILALLEERRADSTPNPIDPALPSSLLVPRLAVRRAAELEVFDRSHFVDAAWPLELEDPAEVLSRLGTPGAQSEQARLDVSRSGRLTVEFGADQEQPSLQLAEREWSEASLTAWIDRRLPLVIRRDVTRASSHAFISAALSLMLQRHGLTLSDAARARFRIVEAVGRGMTALRSRRQGAAFRQALADSSALELVTSPDVGLVMDDARYSYSRPYGGRVSFRKHLFAIIGDLDSEGEEHECAVRIDRSPNVRTWIRNTVRQPHSFWLQTATDRFYPDFVALLMDGTIAAIEYKGAHLASADDAREKQLVGDLWAERSGGSCRFVMTQGDDLYI